MRVQVFVVTSLSVIVGKVFLAVSGVRTLDIQETSPYKRLGGEVAVEGVVNDFLTNVVVDDRLGVRFADIEMAWLRAFLDEWVCETGGPCHSELMTVHKRRGRRGTATRMSGGIRTGWPEPDAGTFDSTGSDPG